MTHILPQATDSGYWTNTAFYAHTYEFFHDDPTRGTYMLFAPEIPSGAVISSASLKFYVYGGNNGSPYVKVTCEDVDDASYPTSRIDAVNKIRTTAATYAYVDITGSAGYRSINVKSPIEEVVARPGWVAGNNILFLVDGTTSHSYEALAYAYSHPTYYPYLDITYTKSSGGQVRIIGMMM